MNIIFTGAGSFSGYWIIKELISNNMTVYPLFEEKKEGTSGMRMKRIEALSKLTKCYFGVNYGSKKFFNFLDVIDKAEIFCHHFFYTKDYKDFDYNVTKALDISIGDVTLLFKKLKKLCCKHFILTGSLFEKNEGKGDKNLEAFSPYGLAKSLSSEVFEYYCKLNGMNFYKFVIPNPFGPYEEYKFTSYLADKWLNNEIAIIKTPYYIRDNIPVDLLAKSYIYLLRHIGSKKRIYKINPSGYVESNLDFVKRIRKEFKERFDLECRYRIEKDNNISEPLVRYNIDNMFKIIKGYKEKEFWDKLINFYKEMYGNKKNNK